MMRYIVGLAMGAVVTLSLFYLMQWLIHTDETGLTDPPSGRIVDFVRVEQEEAIQRRDRTPEPPPPPDEPPPDMPDPSFDTDVGAVGIDIGSVAMDTGMDIGGARGFQSDGDYLPIVRVEPVYPRRALTRGIEGYVLLEFTVSETGSVVDPKVVEAQPPGIFDRAAIQAALRFKYQPRVVDGQPIAVHGVRNMITFELTD
ncbi:MAG: energy transducer TonB [Gammaproteobacteria bacterium]|nr:MAG: energy transducer TonB [Gammaproteobacteria bacterium]